MESRSNLIYSLKPRVQLLEMKLVATKKTKPTFKLNPTRF